MTSENQSSSVASNTVKKTNTRTWLKRLGIAGFLFFLIKGLLWLVLLGLVIFGIVDDEAVQRFKEWLPF